MRACCRQRARSLAPAWSVLVGSGSNGGDALWAGAYLARRGARVDALLLSARAHEAGWGPCGPPAGGCTA